MMAMLDFSFLNLLDLSHEVNLVGVLELNDATSVAVKSNQA